MFKFPKFLIFFLTVVVSFVLYDQFLKLNREYHALRKIEGDCRAFGYTKTNCNFYFRERIFNNYGVPHEKLVATNNRKLLLFNVFVLCLIVQLFAVFAAAEMDVFMSVISLMPLFLFVSGTDEAWLVPYFMIFVPVFAFLFSHLKKLFFYKIPKCFT